MRLIHLDFAGAIIGGIFSVIAPFIIDLYSVIIDNFYQGEIEVRIVTNVVVDMGLYSIQTIISAGTIALGPLLGTAGTIVGGLLGSAINTVIGAIADEPTKEKISDSLEPVFERAIKVHEQQRAAEEQVRMTQVSWFLNLFS